MKNYITLLIIIISFCACTKRDNRKVVDDVENNSENKKEVKTVDIADLPILIDSTEYMIHPIGKYMIKKGRKDYFESGGYESDNYSVTNYNRDRITGSISNVKFQNINSNTHKSLTEDTIDISSMFFLRNVFEKIDKGYFIYDVVDKDTNADGKLGYNDLKSLYISNLNGTTFRKLTPNMQDLINWKIILEANKLYFKTIEDTDNNGEFDKKDNVHYFFVDLNKDTLISIEYYPI